MSTSVLWPTPISLRRPRTCLNTTPGSPSQHRFQHIEVTSPDLVGGSVLVSQSGYGLRTVAKTLQFGAAHSTPLRIH